MEALFRQIVSGERSGAAAACARAALHIASHPYRWAIALRNRSYDSKLFRAHRVAVPVISVGNITLGGTGKTPLVELICRRILVQGRRPVILSRGYRAIGNSNDEAMQLHRNLPGVPHLQGKDRVSLARQVCAPGAGSGPDAIVLDDGFQHRRLARDLDIVLIDCMEPFGYGRLFPRGLLREPIANLSRADLIVLSRSDLATGDQVNAIRDQIESTVRNKPVIAVEHRPAVLRSVSGECHPVRALAGCKVAAFCGIGNPRAFVATLGRLGCTVVGVQTYPDHHRYSAADLADLARWPTELRCDLVVTTQKDLVKLSHTTLGGRALYALQIEAAVVDPAGHLDRCLSELWATPSFRRDAA